MLSPEMYEELSGKLRAMRSELEVTQSQLSKTGMSAKQTAFAMRMLPAQMTDIVVGLSTGQSPFMVLMQQGGHSAMQETRIASLPVTAIPAGMKIPCVTAGSA
ncbi:phage tail length tape measure family protein [Vibrio sp. FNV 38]|nr:phage tail length tape measure family protein [Vibrio sp. FNV 38]